MLLCVCLLYSPPAAAQLALRRSRVELGRGSAHGGRAVGLWYEGVTEHVQLVLGRGLLGVVCIPVCVSE